MPIYDLLEYSENYSMTSGRLWNFHRDEINDSDNDDGNKINNNKTITSKPFAYKTKIIGRTPNGNNTLDTEVVVPLKCLSILDLPLINCQIELDLSWSKEYQKYQ